MNTTNDARNVEVAVNWCELFSLSAAFYDLLMRFLSCRNIATKGDRHDKQGLHWSKAGYHTG